MGGVDEQMSGGEEGQWLGWLGRSVNSRQKPDPIKRAWGSSHSSQKGLPLFLSRHVRGREATGSHPNFHTPPLSLRWILAKSESRV